MVNINSRFYKQVGLYDPSNQNLNIHIGGCGSIGSFLCLNLTKMGFQNISVYDFDKIEDHNIANQFFREKDIGKLKTVALKEIIKEFSGVEINTIQGEIKPATEINFDLNSLFVFTFDTLKARKIVFDKIKGYPLILLDIRVGGLNFEIYVVHLDNEDECKQYEKTLKNKTINLACGMKNICYTILSVVSETSNIIKKIVNNEPYPTKLRRSLAGYTILNNLPRER